MKANIETQNWYIDRLIEGKYILTEEGELISSRTNKPMTKELISSGYHRWRTRDANNKSRYILVHRLMYAWFVGNINEEDQINHIDCNKTNNKLENLELVSNSKNQIHAIINGKKPKTCKLDKSKVLEIYRLYKDNMLTTEKRKELCLRYNVSSSTISNIINRKGWNCYTEEA